MPFSSTRSCTKQQWTRIFKQLIKPTVENAGLGFTCKRSTALRGNILKDIILDLHKSDVIIADLTDQNANVFYELGVRHGLKNGTIILAQRRKDASPFDLKNYASHIYNWKSDTGRRKLARKIQQLLKDVVSNPDKPDNPVSDFLQQRPVYRGASKQELEGVIEYGVNGFPHITISPKKLTGIEIVGLLLYANAGKGISLIELTKQVSKNWNRRSTKQVSDITGRMKGWVIKEGERRNYIYRLSGTGRSEVRTIIDKLKKST